MFTEYLSRQHECPNGYLKMDNKDRRREWIQHRAEELWRQAGCPHNHDMGFWLIAEREYDREDVVLCVLNCGQCRFQIERPKDKGRRVALCTSPGDCIYRNTHYRQVVDCTKYLSEMASRT